jgi:hypothetical protein
MRFTWKGKWKQGEITIEAETLDELKKSLDTLLSLGEVKESVEQVTAEEGTTESYPALPTGLGCSEAIRQLLSTEWGRQQPRSMRDIENALQTNALYFSSGTLSGTLNLLTKSGAIRRFKKDGRWTYVLR